MPIFPPERRPTVDVVTLGDVPTDAISVTRRTLEETFGVVPRTRRGPSPASVVDPTPSPVTGDDQYEAEALLDEIAAVREADLAIGLTDAAVRHDGMEELFGLGYVGGSTAIVSTDGLAAPADPDGSNAFAERVAKQTRKQMGRLLGLETTHGGCVLRNASLLYELDETASDFCAECRGRLTEPETAPHPPAWIVGDSPAWTEDRNATSARSLRTLPLLPTGAVAGACAPVARAVARLSAWESTLPPRLRRPIHGSYRFVRFWALVALFFLLSFLALYVELALYERLFGADPAVKLVWAMIAVALGLGFCGQLLVRALAAGAYEGLLGAPAGRDR